MQLEFFPKTHEERIDCEIHEIKSQLSSMRKALFARHSELAKMYTEIRHELDTLKHALCRDQ